MWSGSALILLALQAHDHIHPVDLGAVGRAGQAGHLDATARDIHKIAFAFEIKMMVLRRIGIEIDFAATDNNLPQKSGGRELMKRVVYGRKGDANALPLRFQMKRFGRDVSVRPFEQQPSERQALFG